jgi:hypothetical protein
MSPIPPPIRRLAFLVIASSLLLFFWMVRGVALPVLVSTLFAILLYPLFTRLEKRLGKRATLAPGLMMSPITGNRGNLNRSRPKGNQHHPRRRGAAAGGTLMS